MLSTWLCELYLNELGGLRDSSNMEQYWKLQEEFYKFLATPTLKVSYNHTYFITIVAYMIIFIVN